MPRPTTARIPPRVAERLRALAAPPGPPGAAVRATGWTPGEPPTTAPASPVAGYVPEGEREDVRRERPGPGAGVVGQGTGSTGIDGWTSVPAALALAASASASPPGGRAGGADPPDGPPGCAPDAEAPADGTWPECACHVCDPQHGDLDHERVPAAERFRWWPDWRTAAAAVLVLALVAGGIALRAASAPRGQPVAIPQPEVSRTPTPGTATEVVVHVAGAVAAPGVVRLPLGARVSDALDAVGGAGPEADLGAVNLARTVTDGEQVVVPVLGAPPVVGAASAPPGDGLVDLNAADVATLETLPGVGPVLAGRIVQHRSERPFTTVDELDEVPGIGPALMADLRPRVRV